MKYTFFLILSFFMFTQTIQLDANNRESQDIKTAIAHCINSLWLAQRYNHHDGTFPRKFSSASFQCPADQDMSALKIEEEVRSQWHKRGQEANEDIITVNQIDRTVTITVQRANYESIKKEIQESHRIFEIWL